MLWRWGLSAAALELVGNISAGKSRRNFVSGVSGLSGVDPGRAAGFLLPPTAQEAF